MDALTVAFRTVHFAAVIALFGEFAFHCFVSRPVLRGAAERMQGARLALRRRMLRIAAWSLAAAVASGIAWLAVEASAMSGLPVGRALDRHTLGEVLNATLFGRIWEIRSGLAVALGAALALGRRAANERSATILDACGGLLAGALLATLAWAGHAAAEQGGDRAVHLSADAAHLLAAGAWLGALPPLIAALGLARGGGTGMLDFAARVTRRFSLLGMASVGTLVLTGAVNSWYTVESPPALFGTGYGRLLLVKLALFGAMVSLAAVNRLSLSPRLARSSGGPDGESEGRALRRLRRNAIAETALGIAAVGIVGALGVAVPAVHVQPVWPFPFTLDWDAAETSRGAFAAAWVAAAAALAFMLFGAITRRRVVVAAGAAGLLAALAVCVRLLAVPAHPTTYFHSPVRYTTDSISRGASLYAQHCAACHGPHGYGDGPKAVSLAVKPANLTEHFFHHSEGDLLWVLQHGIAETPMPRFDDLGDDRLWDLVNFLHAQAEAEETRKTSNSIEPRRPLIAPDFTFQIGRRTQEFLAQQRGRKIVLLVFYRLPESLARLRALSEAKGQFDQAGARVIAMPIAESPSALRKAPGVDASILADPDPRVVAAYAMFRRTALADRAPSVPEHVEFLVDRQGYIRNSWRLSGGQGQDRISALLRQIKFLQQEKYRPTVSRIHVH